MNRTTSVSVIPIEELGHPRIDVVMTVSGIFAIYLVRLSATRQSSASGRKP
jgi:cobalamin biosynthesis Mg chelatase CobN